MRWCDSGVQLTDCVLLSAPSNNLGALQTAMVLFLPSVSSIVTVHHTALLKFSCAFPTNAARQTRAKTNGFPCCLWVQQDLRPAPHPPNELCHPSSNIALNRIMVVGGDDSESQEAKETLENGCQRAAVTRACRKRFMPNGECSLPTPLSVKPIIGISFFFFLMVLRAAFLFGGDPFVENTTKLHLGRRLSGQSIGLGELLGPWGE